MTGKLLQTNISYKYIYSEFSASIANQNQECRKRKIPNYYWNLFQICKSDSTFKNEFM